MHVIFYTLQKGEYEVPEWLSPGNFVDLLLRVLLASCVATLLKRHCLVEITNLCLLNFLVTGCISPNATKYAIKLDKKILQRKKEAVHIVWRECAGLQG